MIQPGPIGPPPPANKLSDLVGGLGLYVGLGLIVYIIDRVKKERK